ncbi:fimbrial protein [Serratia marcescens]|uniref:fimbrial protein n=1 Tax=Serratia marcescens TaxID=615 RepID=UPI00301D87FA
MKRLYACLVYGLLAGGLQRGYAARGADLAQVEGMHATLAVRGTLVESACSLEMASQDQTIRLGDITRRDLARFGAQATPILFHLQLRDCGHWDGAPRDAQHGDNLSWTPGQQSVWITFSSEQQRGGLVRLKGEAKGVALRLEDGRHRRLSLGEKSHAQVLIPGDNRLTFYAVPQRTAERLVPGAFYAVVNFRLSYD